MAGFSRTLEEASGLPPASTTHQLSPLLLPSGRPLPPLGVLSLCTVGLQGTQKAWSSRNPRRTTPGLSRLTRITSFVATSSSLIPKLGLRALPSHHIL